MLRIPSNTSRYAESPVHLHILCFLLLLSDQKRLASARFLPPAWQNAEFAGFKGQVTYKDMVFFDSCFVETTTTICQFASPELPCANNPRMMQTKKARSAVLMVKRDGHGRFGRWISHGQWKRIIMNQYTYIYKDPYEPTSTMESKAVFFWTAQFTEILTNEGHGWFWVVRFLSNARKFGSWEKHRQCCERNVL